MRLLHAACELAAICEGGMTVEDQVKSMDQKYLTPEEIASICKRVEKEAATVLGPYHTNGDYYYLIPGVQRSWIVLDPAVPQDVKSLVAALEAAYEENQRLREELELSQAEGAVRKGWQEKLQARTIELFEREKKLVEALRWYADERNHLATHFDAGETYVGYDGGQRARDTLKALGIE